MVRTKTPLKGVSGGGSTPQYENSKGVFKKLGDRSIPVQKRLKLLRYAWKTHQVNLANKHQTLLHWFSNALSPKSPVKDDDKPYVWICLHEILRTVHLLKEKLYFKQTFSQIILDELQKIHEGKTRNSPSEVLSCCSLILATPGLDRLFLTQYDTLVPLVAVVTQICVKSLQDGDLDDATVELFSLVVKLFVSNQLVMTNAIQNLQKFTTKLFPVVVDLFALTKEANENEMFANSVVELKGVTFDILCARDLLPYYENFLRLKTPFNNKVFSPPKFIESFYAQLSTSLESPEKSNCALKFIPEYFEAFMKAYKPGENPVGFYHFVYLANILALDKHNDAPRLCCLRDLLKVVKGQQVYNVSADIESEDKHIGWLKNLVKTLFDTHPFCSQDSPWYECFDWLLNISYSAFEGKFTAILTVCLNTSQQDVSIECRAAQNRLLCRIASTFGQLRQPNRLLAAIFNSLAQISDVNFTWPSEFVTALLRTLCAPPLTSVTQIWRSILTRIGEMTSEKVSYWLAVQLLSEFLLTMPVTDSSLTAIVVRKVTELMDKTKENVIEKLLLGFEEAPDNMQCSTLHLVLAWEKLMFLSSQTANVPPTLIEVKTISKVVKKKENETLDYLWKMILVGRLRAETLIPSFENPENKLWNHSELLDSESPSSVVNSTPWNMKILGVNADTCDAATWDFVLSHLSLLIADLDQSQLQSVAEFLCGAIAGSDCKTTVVERPTANAQDLALKFLQSSEFHETTKLHGIFLTLLWLRFGDSFSPKGTPKPKKKRKSIQSDIFTKLSNATSEVNSSASDKLKSDLQSLCDEVLEIKPTSLSDNSLENIKKYLEYGVLSLPLEYLKSPELLSVSLGTLAILNQVHAVQVTESCVKILLRLMENLKFHEILAMMDSSSLVQMFVPMLQLKAVGLVDLLNALILGMSAREEDLEQLEPIVDKLCEDILKVKLSPSSLSTAECFMIIFKNLVKISLESNDDEIKKTCKSYFSKMSPVAENLVKKCISENKTHMELCLETMATIITLETRKEHKEQKESSKSSKEILKSLPEICDLSIRHLKSVGFSNVCAEFVNNLSLKKKLLNISDDYFDQVLSAVISGLHSKDKIGQESEETESVLDFIVCLLISKTDVKKAFQDLLENLTVTPSDSSKTTAIVTLKIWQHLATKKMPEEMSESFVASSQQLMRKIQELLLATKDLPQDSLVWEVQNTALQTEIILIANFGAIFPTQFTVLAYHGCQYVDLAITIKHSLNLMSSVFGILNTLLLSYPHIVFNSVPTFLSATGYLLRSLIEHSRQSSVTSENLEPLLSQAQDMDRLFELIKTNQRDFRRVVPYLIAEFVQGLQKGTVNPEIRKCLSLAVNKLISICDEHSVSLLQATIPPGQREIFATLFHDYNKYYRYSGKV